MKFSIFKTPSFHSKPIPKKDLLLVYADDIVEMPVTNDRGIFAVNYFSLKVGANFYNLYLTPLQQSISSTSEGDISIKGFKHKISGSFPGTELQISEWIYQNINRGFVAVQRNCGGQHKIFGHKYNPLYVSVNINADSESETCEITFEANRKTKKPYYITTAIYTATNDDLLKVIE